MQIAEVHSWAEEAGAIALRYFNAVEARIKADRSVVTAADEEIEVLLRHRIGGAHPGHAIVGEEQGGVPDDAEYLWAVDPLDGTGAFVEGLPVWGISIGLLQRGVPVLGCVYLPLLHEWYEVDFEGPARFNGKPIEVASNGMLDSQAWICVPSSSHRRYTIDYPGKARSLGAVAAHLCYVARGTASGALLGRPHLWDIAAALAILRRAGGDVQLLRSAGPIDLLGLAAGRVAEEPLIAGSPAALAMLHARIQERVYHRH